jgi:formate hydrogenlyase subunit 6/NADH:ubiquinone oxidoreductase subunit I
MPAAIVEVIHESVGPAVSTPRVTRNYPFVTDAVDRGIRGTPVLIADRCESLGDCETACPTSAIQLSETTEGLVWQLDYGLCVFCGRCIQACSVGAIVADPTFELAQVRREDIVASVRTQGAKHE